MAYAKGDLINNRYEIVKPIGSGGMAEVYLAKDSFLDREVAIKMLRAQFQTDEALLNQFMREAKSVARLVHPYIINIYDVVNTSNEKYIVMEYVNGITLKQFMEANHLSLAQVLDIGIRLADGIQHAHSRNVVHCDIKPLNILIDKAMNPKIADFGIAKVVSTQTMVFTNTVMGSVHYISPEQAGGEKVTYLSDVYSLGVVLFEMLTGQVPYNGPTAMAVAMMHREREIPRLSEYMESVPKDLQEIIDKAMAKKPEERYQSASELRHDLLNLRSQIDPTAEPIELVAGGDPANNQGDSDLENATTMVMEPVHNNATNNEFADTLVIRNGRAIGAIGNGESKLEREVKNALEMLEKKEQEKKEKEKRDSMAVKRKINYTRLLLIVTGIVVLISVIAHFALGGTKAVVEVPNVVNMSMLEAQKKLDTLKFKVSVEEKYTDKKDAKPGTVLEQSVKPGEKRKEGSLVILYVSKGAEIKGIPDVKGMSVMKATMTLEELGFKVGKIEKRYVKNSQIGSVLEQNPKATDKAPKGTEISLVICEGDKEIPNIKGKTKEQAVKMIQAAGLTVGDIRTVTESSVAKDIVVTCTPEIGMRLGEGDKVNITISDGGPVNSSYVDFAIPGNKMCNISIVVEDTTGKKTLVSGMKKGGIRIRQKVEVRGKAKASLIVDGRVVEEKTL